MLNNRIYKISILQLSTKNIITLLNKLSYLSDSKHLESRYAHIAIKLLKIEYGL